MSIADDKLPIWMRPEPGDRKPRFTREAIAKAALAIADADGFDAVSMRRIAERLGSGTMTLYHYVRTKAELVALMDDALMGEIVLPEGALPNDWREALTAIARRTRQVFRRHPWALVAMQGAVPGPNGARHFEQCLAALSRTSFDRRTKLDVLALVDDFVFGHVLRAAEAQSTLSKEPTAEVLAAIRKWVLKQYETDAFPHTQAFFGRAPAEKGVAEVAGADNEEGRFERGLATLLDGIVRSRPRPTRVPRAKVNRSRR
jgi:AcrR family transcriptional regulator